MEWLKKRIIRIPQRNSDEPYLVRYVLLRTRWFSVYVHKFCASDDGLFHDHEYDSWSWVLRGSYIEMFQGWENLPDIPELHGLWYCSRYGIPGKLLYRPANSFHRILLKSPSVWTLFICGRRKKEWGFQGTDGEWIPWREYQQKGDYYERYS